MALKAPARRQAPASPGTLIVAGLIMAAIGGAAAATQLGVLFLITGIGAIVGGVVAWRLT